MATVPTWALRRRRRGQQHQQQQQHHHRHRPGSGPWSSLSRPIVLLLALLLCVCIDGPAATCFASLLSPPSAASSSSRRSLSDVEQPGTSLPRRASLSSFLPFLPPDKKRFRYQGLIDAGSLGLGGSGKAGKGAEGGDVGVGAGVVAWGDWDGDQFLDAFVLSADRKTLGLRAWDHSSFAYSSQALFAISPSSGDPIVNVVPVDYNRDGHLDVLLMTQRSRGSSIDMEIWLGSGRNGQSIASEPIPVPSSTSAQPMLLDATGDLQMDFLGYQTQGGPLRMWKNVVRQSNGTESFRVTSAPLLSESGGACQLADPHSSAFIDLNGDCMADIFLDCAPATSDDRRRYQIWTASPEKRGSTSFGASFAFARAGYLPQGAGPLSFADMNRDGTIDVVFTSCDAEDCYVNIAYNRQIDLCDKTNTAAGGTIDVSRSWRDWKEWLIGSGGGGEGSGGRKNESSGDTAPDPPAAAVSCRRTDELCSPDDNFQLKLDAKDDTHSSVIRVPFSTLLPGHRPLQADPLASTPFAQPVSLSVGDFDKDGYPDLLLISTPPKEPTDGTGKTSVHILRNTPCSALSDGNARKQCQSANGGADGGRWLTVVEEGAGALQSVHDARGAAWLDIDDDGSLDVMLLRGSKASGGARKVTFIQNNYFHDAFFLKVLTLNGACASNCEERALSSDSGSNNGGGGGGGAMTQFKPWGASLPGASYKFTVLDPSGNRRAQQVGQYAQSSYSTLSTPYSYFGLGRTNNYVEKLFVGSTLHGQGYSLGMEGVIPNSQVVISPYLPNAPVGDNGDDDGSGDSDGLGSHSSTTQIGIPEWHRELYLHPGDWIPWVTVVLFSLILALCAFVYVMHSNEKREDERERKRAVHAINFDALG